MGVIIYRIRHGVNLNEASQPGGHRGGQWGIIMSKGQLSGRNGKRRWRANNPEKYQEQKRRAVSHAKATGHLVIKKLYLKRGRPSSVCKILTEHHKVTEEDPERLTTEFILGMLGEKKNG